MKINWVTPECVHEKVRSSWTAYDNNTTENESVSASFLFDL